jgi:hypothetical protein
MYTVLITSWIYNWGHFFITYIGSLFLPPKKTKIKIHQTIILPAVLYGYETWSLILKKEHRLRVYENRVLRRIFGPKGEELAGD